MTAEAPACNVVVMANYSVKFIHKISPSDKDVGPDVDVLDGAFSNSRTLGRALRDLRVLLKGARVASFRVEGDKVVVFPRLPGLSTYWHAVVLTKLQPKPDFRVADGGSVFLLQPETPAAHAWVEEHIPEDALRLGNGIAVEHRYICDIVDGIQAEGLTLERLG